jgi:hypothetical protein
MDDCFLMESEMFSRRGEELFPGVMFSIMPKFECPSDSTSAKREETQTIDRQESKSFGGMLERLLKVNNSIVIYKSWILVN